MRKFILGFTMCLLILTPLFVFSAPNLAERLKGKILLAVEDHGKTYYVHEDGNRYRVTAATAQKIFEKLALGITNDDLEKIQLNDVGIEPEIKILGECVEVKSEPKIIYIDNSEECDYETYTKQIEQLTNEVVKLKLQNKELSEIAGAIDAKTEAENALRKEYGLKINTLDLEILEISELGKYRYYDLYDMYYKTGIGLDTEFKWKLLEKMFDELSPTSIHVVQNASDFFNEEIADRNTEKNLLNNELQRKLLELQ